MCDAGTNEQMAGHKLYKFGLFAVSTAERHTYQSTMEEKVWRLQFFEGLLSDGIIVQAQ